MNQTGLHASLCPGTLPRRSFLRIGLPALAGLWQAQWLASHTRANAAEVKRQERPTPINDNAIIVLWLWGGPSHMETFDLKPDAPSEYRGEFTPIPTAVPGLEISEHLPRLAALGDKIAVIRSLHHDSPGHVSSTHTMLTGFLGETAESPPYRPKYPDFWSVTNRVRGERSSGVPPHVAMPRLRYPGSAWLGSGLEPLYVSADPNAEGFSVPNLTLNEVTHDRFRSRTDLLSRFDNVRRSFDSTLLMESIDQSNRKAMSMLTTERVRQAFDIQREDPKLRERYGRHTVGQQCLLARRLVEAGVRMVTIDFPCVPGQKAFSWDDHASVWNIFEQMKIRLPVLDQVTSALIEDLSDRGLDKNVLFVVMGEMSHTPRLSNSNGQPGREHWAQTMSVLLAGGGMRMGQAVGATSRKGDEPTHHPLTPNDLLATWYRYFGIPLELQFNDYSGRPTPILPHGRPIEELI